MAESDPTAAPTPTLNLDDLTDVDAPTVSHKGIPYKMRMPNRIGVTQTASLTRLGQRFLTVGSKLEGVKDSETGDLRPLNPEEEKGALGEMNEAIDAFLQVILPTMPEEERQGLEEEQKMALMDFFMQQGVKFRASLQAISATISPASPSGTV